jgi:hypothetical protein
VSLRVLLTAQLFPHAVFPLWRRCRACEPERNGGTAMTDVMPDAIMHIAIGVMGSKHLFIAIGVFEKLAVRWPGQAG